MTNMDELVTWLREQIAERRRRALATRFLPDDPAPAWTYDPHAHRVVIREPHGQQIGVASRRAGITPTAVHYEDLILKADGEHMELNDPMSAVDECDAHEALLDAHPLVGDTGDDMHDPKCGVCVAPGGIGCGEYPEDWKTQPWPCPTIKALAVAYRHRPGYREEWKP